MLVELVGLMPAFARIGEQPEDAVRRVRPLLVVLLDAELDAARSDLFFARAARRHVGLAVFGPGGSGRKLGAVARARGVPWLEVPAGPNAFAELLERAAATQWWRSGPDRRQPPAVDHDPDGTLVFVDRDGQRWRVYDRRGAQRRREEEPSVSRTFVGESGERRECALGQRERHDSGIPTAADLEEQMDRATRR